MSYLLSILTPRPAARLLLVGAIITAGRSPALAATLGIIAALLAEVEAAQ